MGRRFHSSHEPAGAGGQNGPDGIEDESRLLTTDAGRRLLEEVASIREIGPAELDRLRKMAPAGLVSAAVRLTRARRKAAGKFERGDRMWVEPVGIEQATAEPVARYKASRFRAARSSWTSAPGSAATAWPWPITRRSSPWTWTRGCADGCGTTPGSTGSPIACWRCGLGPRRSRSPRAPGSTSTRTAGSNATAAPGPGGLRAGPGVLGLADRAGARRGDQALAGRRLRLALPAGLGVRGRADQPPRRVQGGDGLVRRAGRLPSSGDPAARGGDLDRPGRDRYPSRPGSPPLSDVDLRPGPLADPRRAARRIRPLPPALPGSPRGSTT